MNVGGGVPRSSGGIYQSKLKDYLTDPNSFSGSPGFKFALDSGRQAIERSFAAKGMGNSGNVLSELMKYGTGLASQEYGNTIDRLGRLSGQDMQYELGKESNANQAQGQWWNYSLGRDRNALASADSANQFNLSSARLGLDANAYRDRRNMNWWDKLA